MALQVNDEWSEVSPTAKTEMFSDVEFLEEHQNKAFMAALKIKSLPYDALMVWRLDAESAEFGADLISAASLEGAKAAAAAKSLVWANYEFAVPRQVAYFICCNTSYLQPTLLAKSFFIRPGGRATLSLQPWVGHWHAYDDHWTP